MIETSRLTLRPFEPEDLDAFVAYRRVPDVARFQSWTPDFSRADGERFLAEQQGIGFCQPGAWLQLALIDRATGTMHGDCAVHTLDDQPASTELGITLAPASQGAGYATEALGALLRTLFEDHAMHRVFANVDDRNVAAQRVFERLGLRREARLVEADWWKDEWTTVCVFALLGREWRERAPAAEPA